MIHIDNMDYCELLKSSKKHPVPIVNMFKLSVTANQTVYKCPHPEGLPVDIVRINFDSNWFPMLISTKFKLYVFYDINGFKKSTVVNITGEISNKRQRKIV